MKIAVDLHIHSALSPCGHKDMTPNNIVNMVWIKGLNAIAVTDHNSAENVEPVMKLGKEKGIVVIPGMEIQSREEVHLLCYFSELEAVLDFQELVYENLEGNNKPDFFGEQLVMDKEDSVLRINNRLLIGSTGLSISQICEETLKRGGKVVPAHVNKSAYSIISNLGFIPLDLGITTVEITRNADREQLLSRFPFLKKYKIIRSSDAHRLEDIMERESLIEADSLSALKIIGNF